MSDDDIARVDRVVVSLSRETRDPHRELLRERPQHRRETVQLVGLRQIETEQAAGIAHAKNVRACQATSSERRLIGVCSPRRGFE